MTNLAPGAKNELTLASFELGREFLLDTYDAAREHDPRLDDVAIVPITRPAYATLAMAVPKWWSRTQNGQHEIHIRRGDPERVLAHCQNASSYDPTSYRIMSERIGIDPSRFTPALRYTFATLHELGHVSMYFDYENRPTDLRRDVAKERSMLPYCYAPPSAIANRLDPARRRIERDWYEISSQQQVSSIAELVMKQAVAYRDMPSEATADYFAVEVLHDNPKFMDMLLADYSPEL